MKAILLALSACVMAVPAHALSIVSLHAGMSLPVAFGAVDTAAVVGSVCVLTGVMAFRFVNR